MEDLTFKKDELRNPRELILHSVEMLGPGTKYKHSNGSEGNQGKEGVGNYFPIGPQISENLKSGCDRKVRDLSASEVDTESCSLYVEQNGEDFKLEMGKDTAFKLRFNPGDWGDQTQDPSMNNSKYKVGKSSESKVSVDLTESLSNPQEFISPNSKWMTVETNQGGMKDDFTSILDKDSLVQEYREEAESLFMDENLKTFSYPNDPSENSFEKENPFKNDFQELSNVVNDLSGDQLESINLHNNPDCKSQVVTINKTGDDQLKTIGLFEIDRKEYFVEVSKIPEEHKNWDQPSLEYSSVSGSFHVAEEAKNISNLEMSEKPFERDICDKESRLLEERFPYDEMIVESLPVFHSCNEEFFEGQIKTNSLKKPKFDSSLQVGSQHLDHFQNLSTCKISETGGDHVREYSTEEPSVEVPIFNAFTEVTQPDLYNRVFSPENHQESSEEHDSSSFTDDDVIKEDYESAHQFLELEKQEQLLLMHENQTQICKGLPTAPILKKDSLPYLSAEEMHVIESIIKPNLSPESNKECPLTENLPYSLEVEEENITNQFGKSGEEDPHLYLPCEKDICEDIKLLGSLEDVFETDQLLDKSENVACITDQTLNSSKGDDTSYCLKDKIEELALQHGQNFSRDNIKATITEQLESTLLDNVQSNEYKKKDSVVDPSSNSPEQDSIDCLPEPEKISFYFSCESQADQQEDLGDFINTSDDLKTNDQVSDPSLTKVIDQEKKSPRNFEEKNINEFGGFNFLSNKTDLVNSEDQKMVKTPEFPEIMSDPKKNAGELRFNPSKGEDQTQGVLIPDLKFKAEKSSKRKKSTMKTSTEIESVVLTESLSNAKELISPNSNWMIENINLHNNPDCKSQVVTINKTGDDQLKTIGLFEIDRKEYFVEVSKIPEEHKNWDQPSLEYSSVSGSFHVTEEAKNISNLEMSEKPFERDICDKESRLLEERFPYDEMIVESLPVFHSCNEELKNQEDLEMAEQLTDSVSTPINTNQSSANHCQKNVESKNGNLEDNCEDGNLISEDNASQVVTSDQSLMEEEERDSLPDFVESFLDTSVEESSRELLDGQLSNISADHEDFIQYQLNKNNNFEEDFAKESADCKSGISEEFFEGKIKTNSLKDPKFDSPQEAETQDLDYFQSLSADSQILSSDLCLTESKICDPVSGSVKLFHDQIVMGSFPVPNSQDIHGQKNTVTDKNESLSDLALSDSSNKRSGINNDHSVEKVEVKPIIGSLESQTYNKSQQPLNILLERSTLLETSVADSSFMEKCVENQLENYADAKSWVESNLSLKEEHLPQELLGSQQDITEIEPTNDDSEESSVVDMSAENKVTDEFSNRQDSKLHFPEEIQEHLYIPQRETSTVNIQPETGTENYQSLIAAFPSVEHGSTETKIVQDENEPGITRLDQLSVSAENTEEKMSGSVFKVKAFNRQVLPSDGSSINADKVSLSALQPDPLTENLILAGSTESLPKDLVSYASGLVCHNHNFSVTEQCEKSNVYSVQESDSFKFQIQSKSNSSDVFPGDAKEMLHDSVLESAPNDDKQSTFDLSVLPEHIELNHEMNKETSKDLTLSQSPDFMINREQLEILPSEKRTEKGFNEPETNVSFKKELENLDNFQKSLNHIESESMKIKTDLYCNEDEQKVQVETCLSPQVEKRNFSELLLLNKAESTDEQYVEYQDLDIEDPYMPLFNDALDFKKVYMGSEDLSPDSGKLEIQFEIRENNDNKSLEDQTTSEVDSLDSDVNLAHDSGNSEQKDCEIIDPLPDGHLSESFFQEANPLDEISCFKDDAKSTQEFSQIPNSCLVSHSRHFLEAIPEQVFEDSNEEDAEVVCLEELAKSPEISNTRTDSWCSTIFKDQDYNADEDMHDIGFKRITYTVMKDEDVFEDFWGRCTFPISPKTFSRRSNRSLPEINNRMYSSACLETDIDSVLDLQPQNTNRPCQLDVSESSCLHSVGNPADSKSPCESGSSEFSLLEYSPGSFATPLSLDSDASPMSPLKDPSHFGSLHDMILEDERLARERFFQFPSTKNKKAPEPDHHPKTVASFVPYNSSNKQPCPQKESNGIGKTKYSESKAACHPSSGLGNTVSLVPSPVLYLTKPDSMIPQRPKSLPHPFAATHSSPLDALPSLIKEKPVPHHQPSKYPGRMSFYFFFFNC